MFYTELTATEIEYLARILRLRPDADPTAYATRVSTLLSSSSMPRRLKRPCRLSLLFNSSSPADAPPLCALHTRLNPLVVHSIVERLAHEVGRNLESLVRHHLLLDADQRALVRRLRELHAQWFSPDDDVAVFRAPLPAGRKCRCQHVRCEACVLARVGGDRGILLDLRTVLLSRTRSRPRPKTERSERHGDAPALLVFVEAWLKGLRVGDEDAARAKSWVDSQALKAVRKRIWRETDRRNKVPPPELEPELEMELELEPKVELTPQSPRVTDVRDVPDLDNAAAAAAMAGRGCEAGESDVENDIIDHYAALPSTRHVSSLTTTSGITAVETGRSDISETTRVASGAMDRSADEWARSYQNLLAKSAWDVDSESEEDRWHARGMP